MICKQRALALTLCMLITLAMTILAALPAWAESLFPSPDELFGVTMPDIRYAFDRDADAQERTAEGLMIAYSNFAEQDYATLDSYLSSAGLREGDHSLNDNTLTVVLTKDGADITLRYNYPERKASIVYGPGTRLERTAHTMGNGTVLPDLRYQFGIAIPDLSGQLPFHPKAQTVKEGELDVIRYLEVSRADYAVINEHLTALNFETIEWHADGGVIFATITNSKGALTLRYELQKQCFSIICPELYYIDSGRNAIKVADRALILPDLQEAMGAILPRISSALLRYPDSSESSDEDYREVYQNFSPDDYSVFSAYLLDKGCVVGDYYVDSTGALVIPLSIQGTEFSFTYDQVGSRAIMEYPISAQLEPVFAASAAATPTPRPTTVPTATPGPTASPMYYNEYQCWEIAKTYFYSLGWNNPSSVTINNHTMMVYNGGFKFYIDYSAMNGFGGYTRKSCMIKVNWTTGLVESALGL